MTRTIRAFVGLVVAGTLVASCSVSKQEAPELTGPSVLGTSITINANPDTLRQDGASQAQVVVLALDANSQPIRNLPIRVDIAVNGVVGDFGQVSSRNVTTGGDGRATVVYTAPNPPVDPVDTGTVVQIVVTPTGTDYANAVARTVSIRLVPPGVILPPNGVPTARFNYSPSAPLTKSDVTFDGTASTDSDGQIVAYAWNFGDGTTGSGPSAKHQFQQAGSFTVTLKVTDDRGYTGTATQSVDVSQGTNPVADFVFSPTNPRPNQDIIFNASASRAGVGRRIVSYNWDFGTGRTGSGVTVTKEYSTPAAYNVTLVVTDDAGNTGTVTKSVTVQASPLVATIVYSPKDPKVGTTVFFDAGTSTAGTGRTIVYYEWNFGDGVVVSGKTANHVYTAAGTYIVVLTIRDEMGQVATKTESITVSTP